MSAIDLDDTIVAIGSSTQSAARGVVRISGDDAATVLGGVLNRPPPERTCRFGAELDLGPPLRTIVADVLWWPGERSYTGAPSAEIHAVGSGPVLAAITAAVIAAGARAARPGEFTMRAFLNGKLDLVQAEAVLGVIEAERPGDLDDALQQLAGNLSRPLQAVRDRLLNLIADVEAGLDFVDEDIEFVSEDKILAEIAEMQAVIESTAKLMDSRGGGADRRTIVLRGEPNAGKSSLINRLAGRDAAIVTDVAGTTRDIVSVSARLGDRDIELIDTAGIEEQEGAVSRQSQSLARRSESSAAVRLWCVDASRDDSAAAMNRCRQLVARLEKAATADVFVWTKIDGCSSEQPTIDSSVLSCSSLTGNGLDRLRARLSSELDRIDGEGGRSTIGTAARCRDSLARCGLAFSTADGLVRSETGAEFVAAELRQAAAAIGEVTGAIYTDDILDRVFGRFCIGK